MVPFPDQTSILVDLSFKICYYHIAYIQNKRLTISQGLSLVIYRQWRYVSQFRTAIGGKSRLETRNRLQQADQGQPSPTKFDQVQYGSYADRRNDFQDFLKLAAVG